MRRLIIAAGAVFALGVPAPAAADHVTAAAAIELVPGGEAPAGGRKATLNWSVTCSPGSEPGGSVEVLLKPRNAGLRPRAVAEIEVAGESSGSEPLTVAAGRTVLAQVNAECTQTVESADGESDPVVHRARASATSAELNVPPRLLDASVERGTWCDAERARRRGALQALQFYRVELSLAFSGFSLLQGRGRAAWSEVIVRASGAGVRHRKRAVINRNGFFLEVRPRRPGRLRVWVELGGVKTNARVLRVVPIRGNCRREALAIPL